MDTLKKALVWLANRGKEKTTWYGLVALATSLGVAVSPDLKEAIAGLGVAAAGFIAIITKEFGAPDKPAKAEPVDAEPPAKT